MELLYIDYKKLNVLQLDGQTVHLNSKKLPRISENIYKVKRNTFLQLYGKRELPIDEETLVKMKKIKTQATAMPKEVVYTINNLVAGYIYKTPKNKDAVEIDQIIENLQRLKEDMILLGQSHIYINRLEDSNIKNFQIINPIGFRRSRNKIDQTSRNLDQITDYYFRYLNCNSETLKQMIEDYTNGGFEYIGDYLEESAPKNCTLDEFQKNYQQLVKLTKHRR